MTKWSEIRRKLDPEGMQRVNARKAEIEAAEARAAQPHRQIVYFLLDQLCAQTGHERFLCWNRPGRLHDLFMWSNGLENA